MDAGGACETDHREALDETVRKIMNTTEIKLPMKTMDCVRTNIGGS